MCADQEDAVLDVGRIVNPPRFGRNTIPPYEPFAISLISAEGVMMGKQIVGLLICLLSGWVLTACGGAEFSGPALAPSLHGQEAIWQPTPGTSWQWQLLGTIDTTVDVQLYDIDLVDAPQSVMDELHGSGRRVICYFSAGSWEEWRPDAAQFPAAVKGAALDQWPGEVWLDIRRLDLLGPIMAARLDLAVTKGCDGVEPDNVDGYANASGFPLSGADQLFYNRWLAAQAHQRGLSIGLKNDLDQIVALEPDFDWALNEQCFQYAECELLLPFIRAGKAVFGVEYVGDPETFCPQANAMNFDWLMKKLDLQVWRIGCRTTSSATPVAVHLPVIRK